MELSKSIQQIAVTTLGRQKIKRVYENQMEELKEIKKDQIIPPDAKVKIMEYLSRPYETAIPDKHSLSEFQYNKIILMFKKLLTDEAFDSVLILSEEDFQLLLQVLFYAITHYKVNKTQFEKLISQNIFQRLIKGGKRKCTKKIKRNS
jgi:hypothetical protein